jgi:uncharacterized integral membrane protein (TIGR00698 family)
MQIAHPFALHFIPLSALERGVFLGGTIHDVVQVVAAGMLLGPETADAATVVKLFRVLLLVPVVLLITLALCRYRPAAAGSARVPAVPMFLVAFVAMVALSSLHVWPAEVVTAASDASRWLLVTAIAAAGVKSSFEDLLKMGWWPLLMLLGETLFIAGFVLAALLCL